MDADAFIAGLDPGRHLLLAGATASGKSALALRVARAQGGVIVNADALQVWSCWRVLTARPTAADEAAAPHALYGHVESGRAYSVGDWLAEVRALLATGQRLIVTGGTGLYLSALTEGLAPIPPVPPALRAEADARLAAGDLPRLAAELDPGTAARIDLRNPARVQRAWEVWRATGRGLAAWQAETPAPLLGPEAARAVVAVPPARLAARIAARFAAMLEGGALAEVAALADRWEPGAQWTRAIGAEPLRAHLAGALTLAEAAAVSITATRQYAKAQRSWLRNRMADWPRVELAG